MSEKYYIKVTPKQGAQIIYLLQNHPKFKDGEGNGFLYKANFKDYEGLVAEAEKTNMAYLGSNFKDDCSFLRDGESPSKYFPAAKEITYFDFMDMYCKNFEEKIEVGGNAASFGDTGVTVGNLFITKENIERIYHKLFNLD